MNLADREKNTRREHVAHCHGLRRERYGRRRGLEHVEEVLRVAVGQLLRLQGQNKDVQKKKKVESLCTILNITKKTREKYLHLSLSESDIAGRVEHSQFFDNTCFDTK